MAAKSILNELYQRLRTAAPVYRTQAEDHSDGFVCHLTLPSVESEWDVLSADKIFQGSGSSKKEAEHAAANAAVEWLTAEKVLRPDPPAASHSSRGTAGAGAPSPTASSATSGVSLSGVGSKRSKSSADFDEESTETLELRILEALASVYPRTLNGAQLAKLCGHFKLKSKVNHLLYMKLRAVGLVEMLGTHPPAWKVAGPALAAAAAAATGDRAAAAAAATASTASKGVPAGSQAIADASTAAGPGAEPSITTDAAAGAREECEGCEVTSVVRSRPASAAPPHTVATASPDAGVAAAATAAGSGDPAAVAVAESVKAASGCGRGVTRPRQATPAAAGTPPPRVPSAAAAAAAGGGGCGSGSPAPYARQPAAKQARASSRGGEQQQQLSILLQQHLQQQQKGTAESQGAVAAAAVAGLGLGQRQHGVKTPALAAAGKAGAHSPSPSCSYGQSLHTHSHSQGYSRHSLEQQQQQSQSCGRSATAATEATAAAARRQHSLANAARPATATAAGGACGSAAPAASHGASVARAVKGATVRLAAGSGTDTDDDDISPAVLAAANEAAALEPAPFAARPSSSSLSRRDSQQHPLPISSAAAAAAAVFPPSTDGGSVLFATAAGLLAHQQEEQQQQQQGGQRNFALPNLDLLAAMQLNEQPQMQSAQQQIQQLQQQAVLKTVSAPLKSEAAAIIAADHQQQQVSGQQQVGSQQQQPWGSGGMPATLQEQLQQLLQQRQVSTVAAAAAEGPLVSRARSSVKPQLEAGTKRKYPSLSSSGWDESRGPAPAATDSDMLGGAGLWQEGQLLKAAGQQHTGAYLLWPAASVATAMAVHRLDHMQDDHVSAQQGPQHQQQHVQQLQGQQYVEQQQLDRAGLYLQAEHQQPQRRRRRSGQGPSTGPDQHLRRQDAARRGQSGDGTPPCSNAASSDGGSCDFDVPGNMQGPAVATNAAGNVGVDAEMASCGAGAAADLAAALLNLSAGSHAQQPAVALVSQQTPRLLLQQQGLLSVPGPVRPRVHGVLPLGHNAGLISTHPQTTGLLESRPWQLWGGENSPGRLSLEVQATVVSANHGVFSADDAGRLAVGPSSNPWQWQWQGQQHLFASALPPEQDAAHPVAQSQWRHQQQRLWGAGLPQQQHLNSPANKALRQVSPGPGQSDASMVVGGPAGGCNSIGVGCMSPGMPATNGATSRSYGPAGAAAVEQPEVVSIRADPLLPQQQQQQEPVAAVDLQQSEEQALQLLSRLALPGSRSAATAPLAVASNLTPQGCCPALVTMGPGGTLLPVTAGGVAPAGRRLNISSSSLQAAKPASSMDQDKVVNDPVSVAVAAAAAASKAAAAMAAAASFARVGHAAAAASGCTSSQAGVAQSAGAAAATSARLAEVAVGGSSGNADVEMVQQQVPAACDLPVDAPPTAAAEAVQLTTAAATAPDQPPVLPVVAAVPSELAEEYERRMGAVRDLVQQLNEALQGLNSIREKVEGA